MVTATGALLRLDRSDPRFPGAVVALGCLGVVAAVTLAVQPTYDVAQTVNLGLPVDAVRAGLDDILAAGTSVSLFTTWGEDVIDQVWVKRRTDEPGAAPGADWLGSRAATGPRAPGSRDVAGQLHRAARRARTVARSGCHISGWTTRRAAAPSCRPSTSSPASTRSTRWTRWPRSVTRWRPVLQVSELRTVAADDLWLSPAYEQDSLALHFTWVDDTDAVRPVVAALEERLHGLRARPHWGKVFGTGPHVIRDLYPRLADFAALRRELDPGNVFGNAMVDRYLSVD